MPLTPSLPPRAWSSLGRHPVRHGEGDSDHSSKNTLCSLQGHSYTPPNPPPPTLFRTTLLT